MGINEQKKAYVTPIIEFIRLDNEISLSLESDPPEGPLETLNNIEYFRKDPFIINTT
ncbi:MAG: hypothetical protein PHS59_14385 [Paludibacter sp.]|nr:hypothetical protein [Paludibacter sp.]